MTVTPAPPPPVRPLAAAAGRVAAKPVLLWLLAALVSGFTVRRYLEPFDEGFLLQAASRIAAGQWPYGDFGWPYGPGQPLLVAAAFKALGPSVLWWRLVRVAADASTALIVWALVRRRAGERWALAGFAAAAVTVAQPTSANPEAPALAFALGALLAAAAGRDTAAGVLTGFAVFWRPDVGAAAALAAVAAGALRGPRPAGAASPPRGAPETAGVGAGPVRTLSVAVLSAAALYAPFAIAAGPDVLWDAVVGGSARDGAWWRLPFPLVYDGALRAWPPRALATDLKDVLGFYLPLIGVAGLALAIVAAARRRRRPGPELAGVLVLALAAVPYLISRPDDQHAQPLVVCLAALVPLCAAAGGPRVPLAAVLALVALAGAANRLSALLLPPDLEAVHLPGVPGIRVPPAEARALPSLVAAVQRLVPADEPIYVAPRRSDLVTSSAPIVHFLVRRSNVLHRDVLLQARPAEQAAIVTALGRARPRAIVRWTDPASSHPEPNRRGRPSGSRALDDYLAAAYRPAARYGAYEVLVPR